MPTYEYACTDCGEHIEVVQSMSDEPLRVCGACGGRLRKVFSPIGIVFKGSGFYKTDSRSGSGARKSDTHSAAAAASSSSDSSNGSSKDSSKDSKASSGSGSGKAAESA